MEGLRAQGKLIQVKSKTARVRLVPSLFGFSLILVCHALTFISDHTVMKDCQFVRKRSAYFFVPACYFVNIVQSIIVEEVQEETCREE